MTPTTVTLPGYQPTRKQPKTAPLTPAFANVSSVAKPPKAAKKTSQYIENNRVSIGAGAFAPAPVRHGLSDSLSPNFHVAVTSPTRVPRNIDPVKEEI